MRMLNLSKIIRRLKKSHSLLIGSLFIFIGVVTLSWNYLLKMTDQVYSDMRISMMDVSTSGEVEIENDLQNLDTNTTENNAETTNATKGRKSSTSKQYPLCTRCGKPISNTNPFRVNLAYLTSVASYYREVKEDVPILCNDCAKGLSDAVDKYLINGGAKRKFERD